VTARQIRGVVDSLVAAGHWQQGDPDILLVADADHDSPVSPTCWPISRSPYWCGGAPIGSRHRPFPPQPPAVLGGPRRHGDEFGDPATWGDPIPSPTPRPGSTVRR
jgi:hypothetical protein